MIRKYEAVFLLDDRKFDDNGENFITQKVAERISSLGGELLEAEPQGKQQLAKPIRRKSAVQMWDLVLMLPPDQVEEFRDSYKLDNAVLRHEVIVYDRPEEVRERQDRPPRRA